MGNPLVKRVAEGKWGRANSQRIFGLGWGAALRRLWLQGKPEAAFYFPLGSLFRSIFFFPCLLMMCCISCDCLAATSSDWPRFLGPTRNGAYLGQDLADTWPKEGPRRIWQRPVGQGFSGPIASSRQVILFHRVDNEEIIEAIEGETGKTVWKDAGPAEYRDTSGFDEGPRATPAMSGGRVFAFGAEGVLRCVETATGRKLWSVDARKEFAADKGFFGMACSPLVEQGKVFVAIGGNAGVAAFDELTGKLAWKATDHEAGYSSPELARVGERQLVVVFTRSGLVGLAPGDGKVAFEWPWRARMNASVNAATPLVVDGEIFLSESYGTGCVMLRQAGGKLSQRWASDDVMSNHYATCVVRDGFLYGYHGRQDTGRPAFRCVEWATGRVRWSEERFGAGTVTLSGNRLYLLHEDGRLLMADASPDRFKIRQEAQILPSGVRAHPAIADGRLFARSKDKLVCVDLRASAAK